MVKSMNKKHCFKNRNGGTRMSEYQKRVKIELFNDHFENAKRYQIPHAQLIIADIPYNIGKNAYGSRSDWYVGGGQ
jgi:site-specific DNA-methyltransferase (adenine-specific)